jgi:hypothetical protein
MDTLSLSLLRLTTVLSLLSSSISSSAPIPSFQHRPPRRLLKTKLAIQNGACPFPPLVMLPASFPSTPRAILGEQSRLLSIFASTKCLDAWRRSYGTITLIVWKQKALSRRLCLALSIKDHQVCRH